MPNNHFVGQFYEFDRGRCIGGGGNANVYDVKNLKYKNSGVALDGEYVVKTLRRISQKRKKRFKEETLFVFDNADVLTNVVNIEDYCFGDCYWYLMKKHNKYAILNQFSLLDKFNSVLQIAHSIKSFHDFEKMAAHRDIKPDNILITNDNHALLSDFGCLFLENDQRLTTSEEGVGAIMLRPLELWSYEQNSNIDYRKSDIYMFAKTCWLIVMNKNICFQGTYDLHSKTIQNDEQNVAMTCKTMAPFHEMLFLATKEDWRERITIEECIFLLNKQIDILTGNVPIDEIQRMIFSERNKLILQRSTQSYVFKKDLAEHFRIMTSIPEGIQVTIQSGLSGEVQFHFGKCYQIGLDTIVIESFSKYNFYNKILLVIDSIEYDTLKKEMIVKAGKRLNTGYNDPRELSLSEPDRIVIKDDYCFLKNNLRQI